MSKDRPSEESTIPFSGFDGIPQSIGPYRILQLIGEGGMGTVYLAHQEKPVRRKVALKIIKLGMDTKEVVARFEAERQALALMNHPSIAKVFDGGATEQGRPYFAMEYVPGEPITGYCDRQRLNTRQRLELFLPVCEAIHHAHQKAIIHRDVKPSNVLVMTQDGRPLPKVIDFGVAKATDHRLTEKTIYTEQGHLIGTPEYMSPEQAEMTGLNVDTTTDVYSLGVILYELLVGALPFDSKSLREQGQDAIRRTIREVEPPRPSTRISKLGAAATVIAQHRSTEPRRLERQIRGELDWITMKAMEKDRNRRYQSAWELAADIRRHLANEPVLARSPSTRYQLRKLVDRHRGAFAFSATLCLVLLGFGIWMSVLYGRAVRAERTAASEAATANTVSSFLEDLFNVADPTEARGNTITAREILDRGVDRVENSLSDQPAVRARLLNTLGKVHRSLALYDRAQNLLEESVETGKKALGEDDLQVASSLNNLGLVLFDRGEYEQAEKLQREALAIRLKRLGGMDPETANSYANLAQVLMKLRDYEQCEAYYRKALDINMLTQGGQNLEVAENLSALGTLAYYRSENDEAEAYYRKALDIQRSLVGSGDLAYADNMCGLATILQEERKYEEAERLCRGAIDIKRRILGNDHPSVAVTLVSLGGLCKAKYEMDDAEAALRDALRSFKAAYGDENPNISIALNSLGSVLREKGEFQESEVCYRSALAMNRKILGEDHPWVGTSLLGLGTTLMQMGRMDEAERCLRDGLALWAHDDNVQRWFVADGKSVLGECLVQKGRFEEAESLLVGAYPLIRDGLGTEHWLTARALDRIIRLYDAWGKPEKAQEYRDRAS